MRSRLVCIKGNTFPKRTCFFVLKNSVPSRTVASATQVLETIFSPGQLVPAKQVKLGSSISHLQHPSLQSSGLNCSLGAAEIISIPLLHLITLESNLNCDHNLEASLVNKLASPSSSDSQHTRLPPLFGLSYHSIFISWRAILTRFHLGNLFIFLHLAETSVRNEVKELLQ